MSSRDLKRYDALREIGCMACRQVLRLHVLPEVHHLVDKGYRKHSGGNQATIPLCAWHHRGEPLMGFTCGDMRLMRGPSMFHESKEFSRQFGSQRQLLAKVNELITNKEQQQ